MEESKLKVEVSVRGLPQLAGTLALIAEILIDDRIPEYVRDECYGRVKEILRI